MTDYKLKVNYYSDDEHWHASIQSGEVIASGTGCTRIASILEAAISLEDVLDWEMIDSDQERVVLRAKHSTPGLRDKVRKAIKKIREKD